MSQLLEAEELFLFVDFVVPSQQSKVIDYCWCLFWFFFFFLPFLVRFHALYISLCFFTMWCVQLLSQWLLWAESSWGVCRALPAISEPEGKRNRQEIEAREDNSRHVDKQRISSNFKRIWRWNGRNGIEVLQKTWSREISMMFACWTGISMMTLAIRRTRWRLWLANFMRVLLGSSALKKRIVGQQKTDKPDKRW